MKSLLMEKSRCGIQQRNNNDKERRKKTAAAKMTKCFFKLKKKNLQEDVKIFAQQQRHIFE